MSIIICLCVIFCLMLKVIFEEIEYLKKQNTSNRVLYGRLNGTIDNLNKLIHQEENLFWHDENAFQEIADILKKWDNAGVFRKD